MGRIGMVAEPGIAGAPGRKGEPGFTETDGACGIGEGALFSEDAAAVFTGPPAIEGKGEACCITLRGVVEVGIGFAMDDLTSIFGIVCAKPAPEAPVIGKLDPGVTVESGGFGADDGIRLGSDPNIACDGGTGGFNVEGEVEGREPVGDTFNTPLTPPAGFEGGVEPC